MKQQDEIVEYGDYVTYYLPEEDDIFEIKIDNCTEYKNIKRNSLGFKVFYQKIICIENFSIVLIIFNRQNDRQV